MEPIAYLTVEVKHRDLDPRLLIASHLVKAGISVVVGQQWAIFSNAAALPPGIVLFKTVNEIQAQNMPNFRSHGHLTAATDEEVLQCIDDKCFMVAFSQIAAESCDLFLAQSAAHKDAIERWYPAMAGRVEVAGNSRIDLLSPTGRASFAAEAEDLKREYGPFVLFNTNFGSINSIWRDLNKVVQIAAIAGAFKPGDEASTAEFYSLLKWEKRNFDELLALLDWTVQEVTSHRIVIRPHPGELAEFWEDRYGKHPRVTVVPRSNPHPWIMASDLVIHTGCTTGLEAALMDKPSINLMPSDHPTIDRIVNWANPTFKTAIEAASALKNFLDNGQGPVSENKEKYAAVLEKYLPGYRSGDAAKVIADRIRDALVRGGATPGGVHTMRYRKKFWSQVRPAVTLDKFVVSREEFTESVALAHRLTGNPRLPKIHTLDESLFMLTPA
ncbi:MAG: hypothetical protein K1X51_13400 [Rhodospirillaceae bacterium]|nr:hypothetical protein [Rhodospirillaceae bacterium]